MLKNNSVEFSWEKFGAIGRIWKLLHFTSGRVQSWEDYWQDERKYWNADSRDKSRVELYFGNVNTEQNLLLKTQKKFEEYIAYTKHWHGLCKVGEEVQVISIEPNVIALSKNWQGAVADHSDLELHLNQERTFWGKSIRFYCELYSFGTIAAAVSGSMEAAFGEGHWDKRVAHKQNLIDEKTLYHAQDSKGRHRYDFPIHLEQSKKRVSVGDALFEIGRSFRT